MTSTKEAMWEAASKEHIEFQRAIGGLILQFSNVESSLYSVLRHYAGVSHDVGRAIFSGSRRSKTIIDFIKAIAHNTNMEKSRVADLEDLFPRINEMSRMRDTIVHHVDGSEQEFEEDDPSTRYLTKHFVNKKGEEVRFRIGSAHIDAMSADLLACCWRLHAHTDHTNNPFVPSYGPTGKPHQWQFKSPLQGGPKK